MDRRLFLKYVPAGLVLGAGTSRATVYLTSEDAKNTLFPGATRFVDRSLTLSKQQMKAIAKAASTRVNFPSVFAYEAYHGSEFLGTLFIDKVYGKHEFITYATALDATAAVSGVEVMEYRESYGDEIMNARWRLQFSGKRDGESLRIDKDIKNISGATLSCVHITNGIRRLLATHAIALVDV